MRLAYAPYRLKFISPARTSREVMTEKVTCFLKVWDETDPSVFGIGEAAVFPGLSPEANEGFEIKLVELLANIALDRPTDLSRHSSIMFGLEQALRDFAFGGRRLYFPSSFTRGEGQIVINGLIWMGSFEEMAARVEEKVRAGFRCIKLKVGGIDWEKELSILRRLRERFPADELTLRVDANGAFTKENALPRLQTLADLQVHSIEQPVPSRNRELMSELCRISPTPIALDEELIGIYNQEEKERMLDTIKPAYIILKPALCGGFSGAEEWIRLAEERGTGWWVTSALESNVGLNALAQWTATLNPKMPQGLGTGALYTNNFSTPLTLESDRLTFNPAVITDPAEFANLDWRE